MYSTGSIHRSVDLGWIQHPALNARLQPQTEQSRESGGECALSELLSKEQESKYISYTVYRTSCCKQMESFQIAVSLSLLLTL